LVPPALGNRTPLQTAVRVVLAALLPAVARTYPLSVDRTFIGASFNARAVVASFIGSAPSDRTPFFAGIRVIVTALLPPVASANALTPNRTFVGARRNARTIVAGLVPSALRHSAPIQTAVSGLVASFVAVTLANPLIDCRALIGAGFHARTVDAGLAGSASNRRAPIQTTITCPVASLITIPPTTPLSHRGTFAGT